MYVGLPDPDIAESIRPLPIVVQNLVRNPGEPWRLRGRLVEVVNHGVLIERDPVRGLPRGIPMGNVEVGSPDGFVFQPHNGGRLPRDDEDHTGADNARILEAARFGEVNAYYYADRTIAYANGLLATLGEGPLPPLRVVVHAHSASRLAGYREGDGEKLDGKLRPFPGGHYRLPNLARTDGRFRHPVDAMLATGEVHLGPGRSYITDSRGRGITVGGLPYVRNASHIPGIIVHEVGHHVVAHTADFFANRSRPGNEKVNVKIHMDEGTADYWAAVILKTPDIYNWQHAAEGQDSRDNRDIRGLKTTDNFDSHGNPHRNGNIWASTLWDVRRALGEWTADLLVMKMLVLCSKAGSEGLDATETARQIAKKNELRDGLSMVLKADEALNRGVNRARLLRIFEDRGIDLATPDEQFRHD